MKNLIKKALEWVRAKRDLRFKNRLERVLNTYPISADVIMTGNLFVSGDIETTKSVITKSVIADNFRDATPKYRTKGGVLKPKEIGASKKRSTADGMYSTGGKTASGEGHFNK